MSAVREDIRNQQDWRMTVPILIRRERDHYSAVITDFTIAGQGNTIDSAADNAIELLGEYLVACAADGMTLEEARRPAGLRWQTQVMLARVASEIAHRLHRYRRDGQRIAFEDRSVELHDGHLARC